MRYYSRDPDKPLSPELNTEQTVRDYLREHFKRMAFVRYIEAWSDTAGIKQDKFVRGLNGMESLRRFFVGVIGAMNGKVFQKVNGQWKVTDGSSLYPSIKRMPEDGVKQMHLLAYERNPNKAAG